jgi:endogenous inhibitor of DNA gyrase (YacG/DUF329 family)
MNKSKAYIKKCPECGKPFETTYTQKLYCSNNCQRLVTNRKADAKVKSRLPIPITTHPDFYDHEAESFANKQLAL